MRDLVAGIDAGGTSFKLALADSQGNILAESAVPTTDPRTTLKLAANRLRQLAHDREGTISRLGIGSFGPVDIDPQSSRYGTILKTPKPGWSGFPLLPELTSALRCGGTIETDVNAALLAERWRGAGRDLARVAYVTVGTGVGVGVWSHGRFAAAPLHPELGHIRVERHGEDPGFAGACPFHGGCLEGMVSAPAIEARFGPPDSLPEGHPMWSMAGFYLAQLCMTITLAFRAQRILFGGGVAQAPDLLPQVRRHYGRLMNGYVEAEDNLSSLIHQAGLGNRAGVTGGIALAVLGKPPA